MKNVRLQTGISTASYFNRMMIEDVVTDLGTHGIGLTELFLNSFCEYEDAFVDLLADRVRTAGLSVYSVHPMSTQFEPQLFSLHPRQRADGFRIYESVLRAAKKLGASHYVMHGAAHLSGAAKNLELDRVAPIFSDLADMASSYGITLTLENVSWCMFSHPDYGRRLIDRIGDKLRYTLDTKQAIRSGHSAEEYIDAVGDFIENLHLCDYRHTEAGLRWALPGQGEFDFSALMEKLVEKGYHGPAFIEAYSDTYSTPKDLYDSHAYLCQCFETL